MGTVQDRNASDHYTGDTGVKYAEQRLSNSNHVGHKLDFGYFKPFLKETDVVLDFGCGNGGILKLIGEQVQQADGIEINERAAEEARSSGFTIYTALSELPQKPVYDVCISNHVLEHICDVISTLKRIRQTLKPNALLLLKVPIDDWRTRHLHCNCVVADVISLLRRHITLGLLDRLATGSSIRVLVKQMR